MSPNQPGFRTGDLCINPRLSVTHIYYLFDEGFETRKIFRNISKAFDKVWYKDRIHKLQSSFKCSSREDLKLGIL